MRQVHRIDVGDAPTMPAITMIVVVQIVLYMKNSEWPGMSRRFSMNEKRVRSMICSTSRGGERHRCRVSNHTPRQYWPSHALTAQYEQTQATNNLGCAPGLCPRARLASTSRPGWQHEQAQESRPVAALLRLLKQEAYLLLLSAR